MMPIGKKIRAFKSNIRASTAIMFAMAAPALIGFAAFAVDVGAVYSTEAELQNAADEVALAALVRIRDTRTSFRVGFTQAKLTEDMVAFAKANVPALAGDRSIEASDIEFGIWDFDTETFNPISSHRLGWTAVNAIRVQGHMTEARDNAMPTYFGAIFRDSFDIRVSSTAVLPVPPSFHALSEDASRAVYMANSDLDIGDLVINSSANDALTTRYHNGNRNRGMGGTEIVIAGNANAIGATMNGWSKVSADQHGVRDFMEDHQQPTVGGCDYPVNYRPRPINNRIVLKPGTYCGLDLQWRADEIVFEPGQYNFKDWPLIITNQPRVDAQDVSFFFTGANANMIIFRVDRMFMRAPSTGEQRGVAIMSDRNERRAPLAVYISDGSQFTVWGQVYLPKSHLTVQDVHFNGNCVVYCVIAETMHFDSVLANYFGGYNNLRATGWNLSGLPEAVHPKGLDTSFRPYLIEEQERTIGHVDS